MYKMSNDNAAEKNNVETNNNSNDIVSEEFLKVIKDFYKDVLLVFPEYKDKLRQIDIEFLTGENDGAELFKYCSDVYPKRFFDIFHFHFHFFAFSTKKNFPEMTIILISHRSQSLEICDKLIELN